MVWEKPVLRLVDQRWLPDRVEMLVCRTPEDVADAIRSLAVRGAPAIGAAAAFGLAMGAAYIDTADPQRFRRRLQEVADLLGATRPTAVNLFWALRRMLARADELLAQGVSATVAGLEKEAEAIAWEDAEINRRIGELGASLVQDGDGLLTYCNTGALATVAYGTALGVVRAAHGRGTALRVYVCETRPVLQGARLTAWELVQEGIPAVLMTDNMAGHLMQRGLVQRVIVGADRIAANGDVANKIGTYALAVLARAHDIPFYVAAPLSTIDVATPSGAHIPIEERDPHEVTHLHGVPTAPEGISVMNPAFDVTPHSYITGIITERGIVGPPYDSHFTRLFHP